VSSLAEALTRAGRLISDRTGIISEVSFLETNPEEPAVFFTQTRPGALEPVAGRSALNHGNATSTDPDRATMKAVGETIERYCSAFYDEDELVFGTQEDMRGSALHPESFALFSSAQYRQPGFPFRPFTSGTPVAWTLGRSLFRDCPTWAPAAFVYIPYDRFPDEPVLDDLISTGLACGTSYAHAALKALTEAVERDAYMIVWQNRLPRPHIDLSHVRDRRIRELVEALGRLAIETHAVLLTLDIPIAVILVVMSRSSGPPWTVVASGADLSPRHALLLALEEACLATIGMGRAARHAHDYRPAADYGDVTTLQLHGLAHALDPQLRSAVDSLTRPAEVIRLADLDDAATGNAPADLQMALNGIRPHLADVVAVDVTTADVDEAGFNVVRVVAPELQPMDIDHRYRHLGGARLYETPWKLGLVESRRREGDLNPDPHPFP
jgi:ribosomal protein S12 methylthiotransferase accessory factor